jgi:hypothetical protein
MDHVRRNLILGFPAAAAGASLLARAALAETALPALAADAQPITLGSPCAEAPVASTQSLVEPAELFRRAKEDFID